MTQPQVGLVLVAAGASTRMSGTDKVWTIIDGRPLWWYSLKRFAPLVTASVVVVAAGRVEEASVLLQKFSGVSVVVGGKERRDSVRHGLDSLPPVDHVAVHDAARPFASPHLLRTGIEALRLAEGAIPVVPINDTVKRVSRDGHVLQTLERTALRGVQTPQVFLANALRHAHNALPADLTATDDAALLEAAGYTITTFPGDPANFKVTTPFDLTVAHLLMVSGTEP